MKTAVLDMTAGLRRKAASLLVHFPPLDRRHAVAFAAAVPVLFLGPYVIPFMLALVFFAAAVGVYVTLAVRAGARAWQAGLLPVAMLPFAGLFGPVDSLPNWMQIVAHMFPVTYIIDGVRTLVVFGAFDSAAFVASVILTGVYFFFVYLWAESRAQNEHYDKLKANY